MYLMLNGKKVTITSEVHDDTTLNLAIETEDLNMQQLFDLFSEADRKTLTLYHDDGQTYAVFNYYTAIETFLYLVEANRYTLTLSKVKMDEYESAIKGLTDKLNQLEAQNELLNQRMLEMAMN